MGMRVNKSVYSVKNEKEVICRTKYNLLESWRISTAGEGTLGNAENEERYFIRGGTTKVAASTRLGENVV